MIRVRLQTCDKRARALSTLESTYLYITSCVRKQSVLDLVMSGPSNAKNAVPKVALSTSPYKNNTDHSSRRSLHSPPSMTCYFFSERCC